MKDKNKAPIIRWIVVLFFLFPGLLCAEVKVGADVLLKNEAFYKRLSKKRVGLITNQSAVNQSLKTTFDLLKEHQKNFKVVAVFAPEHGFYGDGHAYESIEDQKLGDIPLYALYGERRRPTSKMLQGVDLLIYDIQDIGSRSYTFISTLFYCMEEAAKYHIPILVLDRPNPMGGTVVDGPLIEEKWRSFLGYVNVPYCHGMTIGELAHFFNNEYRIGCDLTVVPMEGWKRGMTFSDTNLPWVPTSPQIPELDTPFYYPTTGLIGHLSIVSIGVGYTLPFKLIGAPWIDAERLCQALNSQKLPGVQFQPFYYRPFFGKFKLNSCQGVRLVVTDANRFLPLTTQFTMMGVLKNLYPDQFHKALSEAKLSQNKMDVMYKLVGNEEVLRILDEEKYVIWKLRTLCQTDRDKFLPIRKKYLNPAYS